MSVREVNFDGLIGPTHNHSGLSFGNLAASQNQGETSHPRAAASHGLAKMRLMMDLGLVQGVLPPPPRPNVRVLRELGFGGTDYEVLAAAARDEPEVFGWAMSASLMWTANAATVIAAPDSADGRIHLITANLAAMPHRALEASDTFAILSRIFGDDGRFAVHSPLPAGRHFGDEGAANHMRLARSHGELGNNIFVPGAAREARFPERQARRASAAVARLGGVTDPIFALQSRAAIEAGAFHNDVVAVANETVLLAHPQAYYNKAALYARIEAMGPGFHIIETEGVDLARAVSSYLFNSQLVSLPSGAMALIVPAETREDAIVWAEVQRILAADNPITEVHVADVRESMKNGGGPACLRLRVPMDEAALAAVRPGYILDDARWEALARTVEAAWPQTIAPSDLDNPALWDQVIAAQGALEKVFAS
jgi:succinylarginine dihydrolase